VWSKESRSLLKLKLEAFKNSIAKISTEAAAVDFSRLKIKLEVYPSPFKLNHDKVSRYNHPFPRTRIALKSE